MRGQNARFNHDDFGAGMPYTFSWEPNGVYKQFSGVVTAAEYHRSQIEFTSDGKFDSAH